VLPRSDEPFKLHDAQLVIAREHGLPSWPKLVHELDARRPMRGVQRAGSQVWITGGARLRWGSSVEPTYVGALEAAFRGSERPLDLLDAMGDSGLCFRVRWATREAGQAWCGSGPCGEWPEEVAALNAATGYVFEWNDSSIAPGDTRERVKNSVDQGYPVLAMPSHMDVGVVFGYEDEAEQLLVADYWASDFPERRAIGDMQQIGCFLDRVQEPLSRAEACRAGLSLAAARFGQGVVDPDPITGATYYYGGAAFERWAADLERFDELTNAQRQNLFFVNSWTFSALHQGRTRYCAAYLRKAARHSSPAEATLLLEAASLYDLVQKRLGAWDASDATFGMVKQKPFDGWTSEVRRREIELLADVHRLEARAFAAIEQALG
jgi:hypothetical protein